PRSSSRQRSPGGAGAGASRESAAPGARVPRGERRARGARALRRHAAVDRRARQRGRGKPGRALAAVRARPRDRAHGGARGPRSCGVPRARPRAPLPVLPDGPGDPPRPARLGATAQRRARLRLPPLRRRARAARARRALERRPRALGALLAQQLYLLARDLDLDRRAAFLGVAVVALTHPVLTYTTQVYPELPVALAFVVAARLVRRGPLTSRRDLALASLALGTLPWLSTRAWFIAVGVGLVLAAAALRPPDRLARILPAAAPFVASVLLLSALNWRMV